MVAIDSTYWAARSTPGVAPPQVVRRLVDLKWGPSREASPVAVARVWCSGAEHVLQLTAGGRMCPQSHSMTDQDEPSMCATVVDAWNRAFPCAAPKQLRQADLFGLLDWAEDTEEGRAARVTVKEQTYAALVDTQIANSMAALGRAGSGRWAAPKRALHRRRMRTLENQRRVRGGWQSSWDVDPLLNPLLGVVVVARHVDDEAWEWFATRWRPRRKGWL